MTLPLEGVRVVDISHVFALPYAGALMADLGAEVIKVEGPHNVDITRGSPFSGVHADNVPGIDPWNRTSTYNLLNRGKKSLVLDLNQPDGLEVLKDLLKVSDVFMENFTPRVMRRWGLEYPDVKRLNPGMIMVSNTGYGHGAGPYSQYPAQATTQEATHGLAHVTGYRGDIPAKAGQSYVDFLACWACLMGTALALRYRRRSKKGVWIDIGMYQLGCFAVGEYILDWLANGRLGERIGNRHPASAPQGCYPCAGEDQWCVLSVRDDEDWAALCKLIGRPDLGHDPRFISSKERIARHDEIDALIAQWTKDFTKFEVMDRIQGAGVPAGAVYDIKDVNLDAHNRARGFLELMEFPPERQIGKRYVIGRPWKLSKTPISIRGVAPTMGQHNFSVLQDILGYSKEHCAALEKKGVLGNHPTRSLPMPDISMDERVRRGYLAYHDPNFKDRLGLGD